MARAVVRSRRRGVSCVRGLVPRYICASDVRCVRVGCVCVKYICFRLEGKKHQARAQRLAQPSSPPLPRPPGTCPDAESRAVEAGGGPDGNGQTRVEWQITLIRRNGNVGMQDASSCTALATGPRAHKAQSKFPSLTRNCCSASSCTRYRPDSPSKSTTLPMRALYCAPLTRPTTLPRAPLGKMRLAGCSAKAWPW